MNNFKNFGICEPILQAIEDLGYAIPSQIQKESLPPLLAGPTDFLGLAATGTGKTAAFAIPLLSGIDPELRAVQGLILCPTRELAIQVAGQIDLLGKYLGIRSLPIYGGTGYGDQIRGLKAGNAIVVGTPGRVVDHLEKGTLSLSLLKTLVLDEADEMISMGFKEAMETVLQAIPKNQANTWLFSATMSHDVRKVADRYLKDPVKVQVNRTELLPDTLEQVYFQVHERDKPEVLTRLIDAADDFYGIVFCQTKSLVTDLTASLLAKGYPAEALHGDLEQAARDRVMRAFRERKISILVATDVACRGLDVKDISHVINYSIPRELDSYVHRIGRTGRSGKSGIAMSLVTPSHRDLLWKIEKLTRSKLKEGKVPTRREIARRKVEKTLASFKSAKAASHLLDENWKSLLATMSGEEIAARFLSLLHKDSELETELDRPAPVSEFRPDRSRPKGKGFRPGRESGSFSGRPKGPGQERFVRDESRKSPERERPAGVGKPGGRWKSAEFRKSAERKEKRLPPWQREGKGAKNRITPWGAKKHRPFSKPHSDKI